MAIIAILAVITFSTVLCIIEIPKMLKEKLFRELWTFIVLLASGSVLGILKSLNVQIPNPSDLIAWVYSPFSDVMKAMMK